jgi:POT family proton-dependent oligopeptide transporter
LVDGAHPVRKVVFLGVLRGSQVPLFLASADDIKAVYAKAADQRLPAGEFVQVVNPEVYQSWNPIFVVLLTPFLVAFFAALARRGKAISTPRKIFYGMLLTTAAMLVMAAAGWNYQSSGTRVAGLWLAAAYFVLTLGELCLSPMGLSLVTKLSPKRLVGLMMGGWFCATAFGNKLSGFFGEVQSAMTPVAFFLVLTGAAALVALILRLLLPKLEAAMNQYGA